jgi:hypothetical protein
MLKFINLFMHTVLRAQDHEEASLKVDGNEKLGGPKRRQQLNFGLALWRSRVILNLNVLFLCKQSISFSACYIFINRQCHDK